MLVRILKPLEGIVEGVSLGSLRVGLVYDLPQPVAEYLMTMGWTTHISPEANVAVTPIDNAPAYAILAEGVVVLPSEAGPVVERRHTPDRRRTPRNTPDRRQALLAETTPATDQ